jgi:CheY-like chemotaxis protein
MTFLEAGTAGAIAGDFVASTLTPKASCGSNRHLTFGTSVYVAEYNFPDPTSLGHERHMLTRPAFIVAEPEPEQALSSRKLLLETFKFNVITAHSVTETLELVRLFPNADALIVHCGLPNFDSGDAIQEVKEMAPELPIIALTPTERDLEWADYVVQSHSPQELLTLVQKVFGDPRKHPA